MGRIHSIETMGLRDGPGIRFVVFFQGCQLRCLYCHNPDTWDLNSGKEILAKALLEKALRYKSYFKKSGGGITCSGGDPLMQPKFLIEFLKLCKENGLHTAIDTSGFGKGNYEEILKYTDLVILDIKHVDNEGYKKITGRDIKEFKKFTQKLNESSKNVWIRHVVVPGLTDNKKHIQRFKEMVKGFKNVENVELIPYHTLGVNKYEAMGIPYKLNGIEQMSKERIKELEKLL
ncbi:pyruvate formate-lyase 1-activating enzyme [Thermohalobacter berrensis]|uniref:Pyruvate formate-lyase-activating enzyme n=1 Tax=Thermohalobacter berrensis TaxID=99594 RepID=A0A419SWG9_9FIRM|nr:pyruvate formate-lyase 1-activating enzyme [Thermohalobacter berrensis]